MSFGTMSVLRPTSSSCRTPFTAPRMRSRTPWEVSSLAPVRRNVRAEAASRANCRLAMRPAFQAATPNTKVLEPLISVRSRSKNAALGPVLAIS